MNEAKEQVASVGYGQFNSFECGGIRLDVSTSCSPDEIQEALGHILQAVDYNMDNADSVFVGQDVITSTIDNIRQALKEAEQVEQEIENYKAEAYWGLCPICRKPPGHILNVVKDHYAVCHNCKTFWGIGCNLFSSWKDEDKTVWRMNDNLLNSYRKVKPIYIPQDFETDICPRCGASNQATHHFLCQSKDGTPTPYSDEEVKTMIRGLNLGLRHYGIRNPALADDEIEF